MATETAMRGKDERETAASVYMEAAWRDTEAALEHWYAARRARETAKAELDAAWERCLKSPPEVAPAEVETTRRRAGEALEALAFARDQFFELLLRVRSEAHREARDRYDAGW